VAQETHGRILQEETEGTEGGQRTADGGVGFYHRDHRALTQRKPETEDRRTDSPSGFLSRIDLGIPPVQQIG